MRKTIWKIKRSISKVLPRIITDMIKYLLRCFLEDASLIIDFSRFASCSCNIYFRVQY